MSYQGNEDSFYLSAKKVIYHSNTLREGNKQSFNMNDCNLKWLLVGVCVIIALIGLYLAFVREKKNIDKGALDIQDGTANVKEGSFNFKLAIGLMLIVIGLGGAIYCSKNLHGCEGQTKGGPTMNNNLDTGHQGIVKDSPTIDNVSCVAHTDVVDSKRIQTTKFDARTISGDNEIDSDDWTGVELSYSIDKVNGDREIEMTITWYAQEKEKDRSPGDTRMMSSKVISLYKVQGCPELIIKDITGLELQGTQAEDFYGEIHDFVSFPDCGSLRNIKVRFDGSGSNDDSQQSLTATIHSFSIVLGNRDNK